MDTVVANVMGKKGKSTYNLEKPLIKMEEDSMASIAKKKESIMNYIGDKVIS